MPVVYKTNSISEAPKGAIVISKAEAADLVWNSIENLGFWKMLPYKGGTFVSSTLTGITSMLIATKLRKYFKLGHYGYLTTMVPTVFVPVIANYMLYTSTVSPSILLQEKVCPTCLQVRAMSINLGTGVIYPFFTGYAITYMTASSLGTISAPQMKLLKLSSARQEMFDIFKKSTSKLVKPITTFSILHCIFGCAIVMLQMYTIENTLLAAEQMRRDNMEKLTKLAIEKKYREQRHSVLTTN